MKYQNINTNIVKTYKKIREENLNISFPKNEPEMILDVWKKIIPASPPIYDKNIEKIIEIEPVNFTQTFAIESLPTETVVENINKEEERITRTEWEDYKAAKELAEKQAWITAGKPIYQ